MGLYGNMLTYHSGQLRDFTYFNMVPKVNSGYTIDPNVPVLNLRGILQTSRSEIADSNGNLVMKVNEFLWTESVLQIGYFVTFDTVTYRIIPSNDWTFEGGFQWQSLERVVGDNGTPNAGDFTIGLGGTPL